MSLWAYVVIAAVSVALAAFIVLLLVIIFSRKDAPAYWDER